MAAYETKQKKALDDLRKEGKISNPEMLCCFLAPLLKVGMKCTGVYYQIDN